LRGREGGLGRGGVVVEALSHLRNRNEGTRSVQEKLFLGLCFVFGQYLHLLFSKMYSGTFKKTSDS
jgi:hypothetical protein